MAGSTANYSFLDYGGRGGSLGKARRGWVGAVRKRGYKALEKALN